MVARGGGGGPRHGNHLATSIQIAKTINFLISNVIKLKQDANLAKILKNNV